VAGVEQVIRSRFVRVAAAVALVVAAAWGFLPYLTYRVAGSAYVNSELIRVTAPIAGRLVPTMPRKGDFLGQSASVPLIEAVSPDRSRLLDLERQAVLAKENRDLARRQLKEIEAFDFELGVRVEAYRKGIVNRLTREGEEAAAEEAGCLSEFQQRREAGWRTEALTRRGLMSEIRSAEVLAQQEAASTRCQVAGAKRTRITVELEAARTGLFLRDGANDVPYSQQQRDRLKLRRQELETLLLQEDLRANQLAAEVAAEQQRTDQLNSYQLAMPAGHVVWSTAASPGSAVTEAQTILDLADCQHRFVVVQLPERDFEQLKPGDAAFIRLVGGDEWRQGQVEQVRGSAARADDRLFAAQVPSAAVGAISAEVSLADETSPTDGKSFCDIGRLAEVRFDRAGFGTVSALAKSVRWLAGRLGYRTASNEAR
jgi:multidrug resistance efflux pump